MPYIKKLRKKVGHEPLIMTSASGALLNDNNQVLLQARADTGDWGFPGGYMEYGEAFSDTVKREFKEDAGFEITPVKLLKIQDQNFYTYPNGDRVQPVNAFYLVKLVDGKHFATKPDETVKVQYFDLAKEPPKFFNDQHTEMWQILKEELSLK
ncbi:MAG: NUDIX hydrolase [Limosilactobacillus sp.]|jgi:mutator protein MutT|uniref:NUDIX hydrolase n=1 Tax=Limosilactobacillus sp. TaxID=2773925 RepID=UPI0025C5153A|nr:NUDIX hydrolase [Limosilactobacillus sp.]MCI1974736.1 NUDIX hydrolase [Limosilactobacillus sp.]MCI2030516.1 NUDIX hydrolase [Limosilactobacillus sp.]